jgi:cytidylate kinase
MTSSLPFLVIAIDGGAASGKSSTARALCQRFHWLHVDTGSHYRTLTRILLDHQAHWDDLAKVQQTLASLSLQTVLDGQSARLQIAGTPYTDSDLRTESVNQSVSHYAALPVVRNTLKEYQRSMVPFAREQGFEGVVMEGRDIGSVILPDADFRFYLDADPAVREARRKKEGQTDSILQRDQLDRKRTVAPLEMPAGATFIDTGSLNLQEVVQLLIQYITTSSDT